MMGMDRLRELLEAYGAEPGRWPAKERAAALTLLTENEEARRMQKQAAVVDGLLDRATPIAPPIIDAELLVANVTANPQKTAEIVTLRPVARRSSGGSFWLKVTSLAAAAMIGFLVGVSQLAGFSDAPSSSSGLELADVSPW
jgi:hypothetical protein